MLMQQTVGETHSVVAAPTYQGRPQHGEDRRVGQIKASWLGGAFGFKADYLLISVHYFAALGHRRLTLSP